MNREAHSITRQDDAFKPQEMFSSAVLGEWSDGSACVGLSDQPPGGPALHYVCDSVLQLWCRQAEWMEDALVELRGRMEAQLQRVGRQARGRALGECR